MFKFIKKFLKEYEAQIIIVVIILLIFNPYSRAFYKSVLLIIDLIPNSKIRALEIVSRKPTVREVNYASAKEKIYADLWIPNESGKHPAVVLDLGLSIDKRDPRVQRMASSLARAGIVVLVPNIPTISQRRLTLHSPIEFKDSFKYLSDLKLIDQKKLGFMAFCGSSGPAFIAAQYNEIKNRVSFFVTIDPYFDLNDLYREIVAKNIDGRAWVPYPKTVEIFNREAINLLKDEDDKRILLDLLVHIPEEELSKGEYKAVSLAALKTKEARITYEELTNKDPNKVEYYLVNAPERQKEYLKKMSPSSYTENFKSKLFILSEKPSPYLPYTQAKELAEEIDGSFIETVDFTTADVRTKVGLMDSIRVLRFIWVVFSFLGV